MVSSYQHLLDVKAEFSEVDDLRTAAFVLAVRRIVDSYDAMGV